MTRCGSAGRAEPGGTQGWWEAGTMRNQQKSMMMVASEDRLCRAICEKEKRSTAEGSAESKRSTCDISELERGRLDFPGPRS